MQCWLTPPWPSRSTISFFTSTKTSSKGTAGPSTSLRSGRGDNSVMPARLQPALLAPTTELSSRPERSEVEGAAVPLLLVLTHSLYRVRLWRRLRVLPVLSNAQVNHGSTGPPFAGSGLSHQSNRRMTVHTRAP